MPKPKTKKPKQNERKFFVWSCDDRAAFVPGYVLPSLANERLHWRSAATLKRRQRELGMRIGQRLQGEPVRRFPPCVLTLKRNGVRLLDDDNLAAAWKHVRDGIAESYDCGDGPDGPIVWRYEQAKVPRDAVGIEARWSART